jgi:hypothetical protein
MASTVDSPGSADFAKRMDRAWLISKVPRPVLEFPLRLNGLLIDAQLTELGEFWGEFSCESTSR